MMVAASLITQPEGHHACFLGPAPVDIDFAMANAQGVDLVKGIEAVYDVPWNPHIGLKVTLRGEAQDTACRRLGMPRNFPHPPRPPKPPDPSSKRAKQRLQRQAAAQASAGARGGGSGSSEEA